MAIRQSNLPLQTRAIMQASALAVLFLGLIFLLPANSITMRDFNLSSLNYKVILFGVSLPFVIAWTAAFVGYYMLKRYAYSIRKTPEGQSFAQLAAGSGWLAWSLPITAIAALCLNGLADQWHGLHATSIIVSNYLNLLLPLIAFTIIGSATRELISRAKIRFNHNAIRAITLLFIGAGVLYCYLTFQRFDLDSLSSTNNPYSLPIWLVVTTITVPYLYTWFIGLLAAYEVMLYSHYVKGVLYRYALRLVSVGLATIIAGSIAAQYSNSIYPRVGHLVISYGLILNAIFRLVSGVGFILVALGAARLQKIEEV